MELNCISESLFFDFSRKFEGVRLIYHLKLLSRRVLSIGVVTEEFTSPEDILICENTGIRDKKHLITDKDVFRGSKLFSDHSNR